MKKFKNLTAKEMFEKSERMQKFAIEKLEEGVRPDLGPGHWLEEANRLRMRAEELENGHEEDWDR